MSTPCFRIKELTIKTPNNKCILSKASIDVNYGEIILLIGPSGSGKTSIIKLLSGILDVSQDKWHIDGSFESENNHIDLSKSNTILGGYIFQKFALFDDLSLEQNILIAKDHGKHEYATFDLSELTKDINLKQKAQLCSEGQKQRVSIIRAIQSGFPFLLFDEPNSGLDINLSKQLAVSIKHVVNQTNCPAIIVAHHYETFLSVCDRLLILDPKSQNMIEIPEKEITDINKIEELLIKKPVEHPSPLRTDIKPIKILKKSKPKIKLKWFSIYFYQYMFDLVFSPTVLIYMAISGILSGFISTWFLFQHFPYREFLSPIIHESSLQKLGFVQFRILVPLVTSLLLASRNSAIISADIGHRVYSEQISAMNNLSIPYHVYISLNIVLTMIIGSIAFFFLNFLLCAVSSMYTWSYIYPQESITLWKKVYYNQILSTVHMLPYGISWIFSKMIISGFFIGLFSIVLD